MSRRLGSPIAFAGLVGAVLAVASCASLAGLEEFGPADSDGQGASATGGGSATGGAGTGGAEPHCKDGMLSGDESDLDCGGSCMKCPDGANCNFGADCVNATCILMSCASTSCADEEMNGSETDVDCGGGCPPCAIGAVCGGDDDCRTGQCTLSACACNNHLVISEFRTRGPEGAQSEIVELYNASSSPITLSSNFTIESRDAANASFTTRWTGDDTALQPQQRYLIAGQAYAGPVAADSNLASGITDASAVRLREGINTVDSLCVCDDETSCGLLNMATQDCPGTPAENPIRQSPVDSDDLSLERKVGGVNGNCQDTDDTDADFGTITPSDPQNTSSPIAPPPAD